MNNHEIFLRGIWKLIQDEDNTNWIERASKIELENGPMGDLGPILKEMIDKGIDPKTIARLFKIIGYETAFSILYHLEDPSASYDSFPNVDEKTNWGLFILDKETDEPKEEFGGLYESLLTMDPTGREMYPKKKR